jgi:hypothetical protein
MQASFDNKGDSHFISDCHLFLISLSASHFVLVVDIENCDQQYKTLDRLLPVNARMDMPLFITPMKNAPTTAPIMYRCRRWLKRHQ